MSATDVAHATGGRITQGDAATTIDRVSIDTRALQPGDLFVAIRGDRFDGHRFVADALDGGAIGAVVHEVPAALEAGTGRPALLIEVEDTTRALQALARDVRRRSGAKVVAITGSAGKTTTKEIAAEFLSLRFNVFRNKGNLNNHIGLPLSLMELRARPEIAVVELGMNHPGEIRTLVGVAEPDVRVWTNVGDAHLGFFESADAIAEAKAEILEQSRDGDVLVANANDPRVMSHARAFKGQLLTFGIDTDADVRATAVAHRGVDGMEADVTARGGSGRLRTAAARGRQPVERARGDRGRHTFQCAAARHAGAGAPAHGGASSRRAAASAGRGHAHRRFVQLEPGGAAPFARNRSRRQPAAPARSPCSARCWSSAHYAAGLHGDCGRAAARSAASIC